MFKAEEKRIFDLFNRQLYQIPRNQRRYVWSQKNWEELYDDLVYSMRIHKFHFIGSFVLTQGDNIGNLSNFTIIDGQQRIISLTIMLSSILFWMRKKQMRKEFEGTLQYVYAKDDESNLRVMVTSEYHQSLGCLIKNLKNVDANMTVNSYLASGTLNKDVDKNIIMAFKYFLNRIQYDIEANGDMNFLIELRNQIVNITYIGISTASEEESYTIFEILNARGTPLEDCELLKNYIMRDISPTGQRDDAKITWNNMENKLGKAMNDFIKHYTVHKFKYNQGESSAYKVIQSNYKRRDKNNLLEDLMIKSEYYKVIIDPENICAKDSFEYKAFTFFKKKRLKQVRPLLLSVIHKKNMDLISKAQYEKFLNYLYNFYVCFNVIGDEKSNKLTNTINKYAEIIENNYHEGALNDLIVELKLKLPEREVFINNFKTIGYSHHQSYYNSAKDKNRVQIVLEILERYLNSGYCKPDFTIEHVLDDADSKLNGQIGNLIPLSENENHNLIGKSYEQKISAYANSDYRTARDFSKRFNKEDRFDIDKRTEYLAGLFYDNILKLSEK